MVSRAFCAAVLGGVLGFACPALAGPNSLREGLFGHRSDDATIPPVARYVSADGQAFILDRSAPRPLLKFEDSPEVWVLQPHSGPRGDVIYKNDLGVPLVRATRLGGLTVFTPQRPDGAAAALAGGGVSLRLTPLGPQALLERLAQASARASRAARHLIAFDADATPGSSALIADAAMVTSEAVIRLSRRGDGRDAVTRLRQVQLIEGKKAAASVEQGRLRVIVAPGQGQAGRPSSERIAAAMAGAR